jgi:DNA invertase Pin-like site-specific DNA recombinase
MCKNQIFGEKQQGDKTDRAQLRRVLDQLKPRDVLIVTRLDRLARSTRDLLNIVAAIGEKDAAFRSLADTWADTDAARPIDPNRNRRAG